MIAHKVCMLGSFAVGKTSLVRRFVETLFSDTYQTTVGVKVDKKIVDVSGQPVTLVLWDIQGVEEAEPLRRSYLRGAHGYLVGDTFSIADLSAAAIMSAIVRPPQFAYPLPEPRPQALVDLQGSLGERPAWRWVLDTYARHRGTSAELTG